MPRRREVPEREVIPDLKFNDRTVTKFINVVMHDGKKATAEKIFYGACDLLEKKMKQEPMKVFAVALENVKALVEGKARRVGGSTYQVPVEVRPERRNALGMRWVVQFARERGEKTMIEKLANELLDAANNRGNAVKKKEDVHRMAEANKAFAHYRW